MQAQSSQVANKHNPKNGRESNPTFEARIIKTKGRPKVPKKLLVAIIFLALSSAVSAGAADVRLTVSAGHPPVFLWVKGISEVFIPEVERRIAEAGLDFTIEWNEAYGGSIARIGGELQALEHGLSDMGIVGTIFQASELPLHNVSYFAPFGSSDIGLITRIIAQLQETIPAMAGAWADYDQVYLGGAALDTYHLFTNFPVDGVDDVNGHRILAPGPSANWIRGTGAVAVASALPEYYNNIQTGVADGVVTFLTGAWPIKLWEVAPYMATLDVGSMYAVALTINRFAWDRLPPEVQAIFLEAGEVYTRSVAEQQAQRADTLFRQMVEEHGLKVTELSAAERKRWAETIENPAAEWVAQLEASGQPALEVLDAYLRAQEAAGVDLPRDWAAEPK